MVKLNNIDNGFNLVNFVFVWGKFSFVLQTKNNLGDEF